MDTLLARSFIIPILKTDHMLTIPWAVETGWGTPQIQPCSSEHSYAITQPTSNLTPIKTAHSYSSLAPPYCITPKLFSREWKPTTTPGDACDYSGPTWIWSGWTPVRTVSPYPCVKIVFGSYNSLLRPSIYKLQTFDGAALLELIKELVRLDKHWIPKEAGHSLYIRPTLSKLSQRQLLGFLLIHTFPCSWHSTRHWGQPTQWSSPLCHPQSRRTILSQWIQARGALWHNRIHPRRSWRYVFSAPCFWIYLLIHWSMWHPCRHWRLQARC